MLTTFVDKYMLANALTKICWQNVLTKCNLKMCWQNELIKCVNKVHKKGIDKNS